MEFSDIQQKKWVEIRDKYEKTKDKIIEIQKCDLIIFIILNNYKFKKLFII